MEDRNKLITSVLAHFRYKKKLKFDTLITQLI